MHKDQPSFDFYHEIAAKATTLREKIDEPHRFKFMAADDRQLNKYLAEWRKALAPDDPGIFENRLKNDGLSENDLRKLLGTVTFDPGGQLPSWIAPFREMMEFLRLYDPENLSADMERIFGKGEEKKIPFLHLITPIVLHALQNLDHAAGERKAELFSADACRMLHLQIARILVFYTSQTFQLEFTVFRKIRQSPISRLFDMTCSYEEPETGLYLEFINWIFENGWQKFFSEYSVLARIITVLTTNWSRNSASFINRLAADLSEITCRYAGGESPGLVTEFKGSVSDAHDHGKGVISLKFESGMKLVYKPKNLELEQAWSEFIGWFNAKGLEPDLKALDVIQRGEYGWVGFIEPAECESQQEVIDYYRRIGSLIGIIYLLHGNDCHQENLIASGAHPILIDLESVMHHEGKTLADEVVDSAFFLADAQFGVSVFRTGLLPSWIPGKDGYVFDISGIGGYGNPESPYLRTSWENINTDRMDLSFVPVTIKNNHNVPVISGKPQLPGAYTEEIVSGFTAFYRLLVNHRQEVPLQLFAGKELRFIFRSTRIYGLIMKKLMSPRYMRNGIERSIQTEPIYLAFLNSKPPNSYWAIGKSECRQIEELDFPIFWVDSNMTSLKDNLGNVSNDYMRRAVYEDVVIQMTEMDECDLTKQVKFIRAALFFRDTGHMFIQNPVEPSLATNEKIRPVSRETLVQQAMKIARTLESEAIFSKDGSCSWISVGIIPGTERFRMQPMSMFLYDGLPGVALFLSVLSTVSDDPGIKLLNEATIRSIRQGIVKMQQFSSYFKSFPIGITSGLSSIIYSLLKISIFLEDSSFNDDAIILSDIISPAMIQNDKALDIISGSAGCILAMLSLYGRTKQQQLIDKAVLCGDHLLRNLHENPDGHFGWKTLQGKMLAGFSHGQAGIAYSLLKLSEITGDPGYQQAAERAIRYENSLFSEEYRNWSDLREFPNLSNEGPRFMTAWCHGAAGIGMARLAANHLLDSEDIQKNIIDATITSIETPVSGRDHLCCGNMGRIETLLINALKTGNDELMKTIYQHAGTVIQRAEGKGRFTLFADDGGDFFNPGFFQGLSGIGYEFLRLVYPEKMPSILIFE